MTDPKPIYAVLYPQEDKSFVLEKSDEKFNFSAPSPVEGLKITSGSVRGREYFQVRPMTEEEKP